jgi:5-methylcytosine-specific restriction enzyme A
MARRKSFTGKDRLRLFALHSGTCYLCDGKIGVGEVWQVEHVVPWALTQDDTDDNLRLVHDACHKGKTANDVRGIRKADRVKAKHFGAKPKSQSFQKPKGMKFNWSKGRYEQGE